MGQSEKSGASFLEVAGILTPELARAWQTRVRVPLSLMTTLGKEARLTVQEILNHTDSGQWASVRQPHMDITLYDPDRMHEWVLSLTQSAEERMKFAAEPDPDLSPLFPKIVAVKIDRSTVPAPGDPLFTGEPDLVETQPGFVVRQDLSIQPDGSFSLPPD